MFQTSASFSNETKGICLHSVIFFKCWRNELYVSLCDFLKVKLESYDQVRNETVGTESIVNIQAKRITPLQPSQTGSCFANKQSILVQK